MSVPHLDAAELARRVSPRAAVTAVEALLRTGFDPADDPARVSIDLVHGQFLLMPSQLGRYAGVKVATVAPGNPARGLPRIQATYTVFDAETLTPIAGLDGLALTSLRTPAVSLAGIRGFLGRLGPAAELVVFGAGPQGRGHVETLLAVLPAGAAVRRATFVVRHPGRAARWSRPGIEVAYRTPDDPGTAAALRSAGVVICATTARQPLFDSALLGDAAIVVAVGSHTPDAREVDAGLCARAQVVVEDVTTALRECGDVVLAVAEGALAPADLVPLKRVVTAGVDDRRPVFFKSAGMSWEDLVVAVTALHNPASAALLTDGD